MRNLYERLKPEYKAKLDEIKDKYPNTYEDIDYKLKTNRFYTELTIGLVGSICSLIGLTFTLSNFIDLFDEE